MPVSIDEITVTPAPANNQRIIPSEAPRSVATYSILSDGTAVSRQYHVVSILCHKEVNRIPFATIILNDGDPAEESFPISNAEDFEPGKTIEIKLGYRSQEETVFKGIVVKHGVKARQGSGMLVVECRDAAVKMTISPKCKYSRELTDSDAMVELLDAHQLDHDVEATSLAHNELVQYNSTDWDFMLCRADACGKLCIVSDGKVEVKAPQLDAETVLNIQYGATIYEMDAEIDARLQLRQVSATAWDSSEAALISGVDAAEPSLPEAGNLSPETLAGIMGEEKFQLLHSGALTQEELQQWADSKLLRNRLAKIRGRVTTDGTSVVQPGQLIELNGAGERFEGKLFVTGVRQHLNEGLWRTTFQFGIDPEWFTQRYDTFQPLAGALLPPIQGLQIGVVTDLEDPESKNRIMVRVPTIMADDDGIWSRVATLDAGNSRGTFFLPEIGDEVIVGFLNNDPRHAVVLGMMNSAHAPAPIQASNDNHEKGFVSRSEMKMIFNDDQKTILIETPAGNRVLLSEEDSAIKLEDQNGNKITMDQQGIALESALHVELKAPSGNVSITDMSGSTVKAEPAGATIQSAGKLTLQGAQVEIVAGQLSVNAAMAQFAGVVQCATLIASTGVVSPSYTPGAGNIF
ncbi:MAG: type VI secretion system tip protein VgrG [Bacteroidetes bacterium]|nr:type VI secretion system tip protein VgrG [Bacteroidota bacterium]MBS1630597.1 type VI secretion system tip protein VgrG [Bacteroidota bacterium]